MAYNFNEEDKQVREFADRIGFGVHKVQLIGATAGETEDGKSYIEVGVVSEDGIEETVRLWFVGGAANISFNTLRSIAVHNAKDEDQKAKARDAVDAVKDSEELANLMSTKVAGGELWLTKYLDPSRTYQNAKGETKPSINVNIYGYEPKLKPELMPKTGNDPLAGTPLAGGEQVPFESKGDAPGSHVPKDDAWA